MFKRDNLPKAHSEKSERKRYRNVIMNFRVTAEEKERIEKRMELSGLSRQEFFIQSLMYQKVVCIGNVKSFEEINKRLSVIEEQIRNILATEEINQNALESLRMILELYDGLNRVME